MGPGELGTDASGGAVGETPVEDVGETPEETATPGRDTRTDAEHWWLKLQVTFGLAGGAIWFAGAALDQDFVAGAGCGLIVAALVLRLGRRAATED